MTDRYPIGPIGPEEFTAVRHVDEHAFHGRPPSEPQRRAMLERVEFDRTLAAFDAGSPVAIASVFSFRMCVPGAMAPAAGVSWVAVMPTHRRRGLVTSLMLRQLADIRERGEAIAVLWASEAGIYGRFGYGTATWVADLQLGRGDGALGRQAPAAEPGLRLRIAEPGSVRAELSKVHDTVLPTRPGMFAREERWWNRVLWTGDEGQADGYPLRCMLAEDDSGPRGYALYLARSRWDEDTGLPDASLTVHEMIATDPAATAAIWGNLLSRDLVAHFTAPLRPVDDPLLYLLADLRRARSRVSDGLWLRIVDLPRALAQRGYSCPLDVVIDVRDPIMTANQGTWRLRTHAAMEHGAANLAASCEPAAGPADLSMDVGSLGAANLGGSRLSGLAGAGQITEHRRGALAALAAAMSWEPAPWCPLVF
jgi:predicted acetyltransferase